MIVRMIKLLQKRHRERAPWRRPWDHSGRDTVFALGALVAEVRVWPAKYKGECCTCGHEWREGELIGSVTQAYELLPDGDVQRRPGTRLACVLCVERTEREGDLSLQWVDEQGQLP
jgi:hypothetical protein